MALLNGIYGTGIEMSTQDKLAEALRNAREYVQQCFDMEKAEMSGYPQGSSLPAIGETLRVIDEALQAHAAEAAQAQALSGASKFVHSSPENRRAVLERVAERATQAQLEQSAQCAKMAKESGR